MADLTLRRDLVEKLQRIAEREQRPVDEVIETLLEHYTPAETSDEEPINSMYLMGKMAEADDPDWETAPKTDVSIRSREILKTEFVDYLIKRRQRSENEFGE